MASDFASRYDILQKLGSGSYGSVYKVKSLDDDKVYALKVLEISEQMGEGDDFMREVYIMMALVHPNILKYYKAIKSTANYAFPSRTGILVEYCSEGDMENFIKQRQGTMLSKQRLTKWMKELSSAVAFLHDKSIMHRDLKPQNIFLDHNQNIKIGDFGVSRLLTTTMADTIIGTPLFMSPEALYGNYNFKADIYSLGCVFLCMATLQAYPKTPRGQFYELPDSSVYGDTINYLIINCISHRSEERPNAEQLLKTLNEDEQGFERDGLQTIKPHSLEHDKTPEQDKPAVRHPLTFHEVHSSNISITDEVARRGTAQTKHGIVFSNRPLEPDEEVTFEIQEVTGTGHSLATFGFTTVDPNTIQNQVPESVRKMDQHGESWIINRYEKIEEDTRFSFHYNSKGDIFSTCKGREKYRRENQTLKTDASVWAMFSVSLNIVAVNIVESSQSGSMQLESVVGFPGKPIGAVTEECLSAPATPGPDKIRSKEQIPENVDDIENEDMGVDARGNAKPEDGNKTGDSGIAGDVGPEPPESIPEPENLIDDVQKLVVDRRESLEHLPEADFPPPPPLNEPIPEQDSDSISEWREEPPPPPVGSRVRAMRERFEALARKGHL